MPQRTRSQHYVSQFYLKRFAGADGRLRRLDVRRRQIAPKRSPRSVCQEEYFYGVQTGQPDEASELVESTLNERENELATRLPPVEARVRSGVGLDVEDRRVVSELMSMLHLRGPEMRSQIQDMASQLAKGTMRILAGMDFSDDYIRRHGRPAGEPLGPDEIARTKAAMRAGDFEVTSDNAEHLSLLDEIPGFARLFASQDWHFFVNGTELPFVTTCHPVVAYAPPGHKGPFPPAFDERVFCFALTPDIALVATEAKQARPEAVVTVLDSADVDKVHHLNCNLADQAPFVLANSEEPLLRLLADLTEGAT